MFFQAWARLPSPIQIFVRPRLRGLNFPLSETIATQNISVAAIEMTGFGKQNKTKKPVNSEEVWKKNQLRIVKTVFYSYLGKTKKTTMSKNLDEVGGNQRPEIFLTPP